MKSPLETRKPDPTDTRVRCRDCRHVEMRERQARRRRIDGTGFVETYQQPFCRCHGHVTMLDMLRNCAEFRPALKAVKR